MFQKEKKKHWANWFLLEWLSVILQKELDDGLIVIVEIYINPQQTKLLRSDLTIILWWLLELNLQSKYVSFLPVKINSYRCNQFY